MTDTYGDQTGKKYDLNFIYDMTNDALQEGNNDLALQFTERGLKQAQSEGDAIWLTTFEQVKTNLTSSQQKVRVAKGHDLIKLRGIGPSTVERLQQAGIRTISDLLERNETQLSQIQGIGIKTAQKILTTAREYGTYHQIVPVENIEVKNESSSDKEQELIDDIEEETNNNEHKKKTTPYQLVKTYHHQEEKTEFEQVEEDFLSFQEIPRRIKNKSSFPRKTSTLFKDIEISTNFQPQPNQMKVNEVHQTIQERKEELTVSTSIDNSISNIFHDMGYNLIPPQFQKLHALDILAVRILEIDEERSIILIIPLIFDKTQFQILVSEQTIRYDTKDHSRISEINPYNQKLTQIAETLFIELITEQEFFRIIKTTVHRDIKLEKSIERKSLYFNSGNSEVKMIIEPVLVTQNTPLFSEKTIPFAYQRHSNLHIIGVNQFSSLLHFLEQKHITHETHSQKSTMKNSYERLKHKFSRYFRMMQFPFIGYLAIIGIIFFSNLPLLINVVISLGYAALGIYLISTGFLYYIVFREKRKIANEFLTPFYRRMVQLSDDELLLINEELSSDYMEQLGYEWFGKEHSYKTLHELEQKKVEQEIINTPVLIEKKVDELYEPKESNQALNKRIIEKYSLFLED
jgi:hypothetical protein